MRIGITRGGVGVAVLVGVTAGLLASPVMAGTVYRWKTEEGTYAFTDDKKRIPERYAAEAERVRVGAIEDYERHTPSATVRGSEYEQHLKERLEHLRKLRSVQVEMPREHFRGRGAPIAIRTGGGRYGGGGGVNVGVGRGGSGAPVVVKNLRTRPQGSIATRHVTVVERGGDPIAIITGELNQTGLQDIPDESTLFDD